ncbi:hypothetical protein H6P81_009507 [Aristolochia fimbriata]|uniref:Coiled-coil SMC6 And NSE5 INteracting (CANIN) domain-containing protein n=1 Tax=Aristolochia fimbriata TaxID=158543 RepID=A0AAV7EL28_ARIFI|nr:hypothetical protein H6P81_009507 [Aristolochia fimbriata]
MMDDDGPLDFESEDPLLQPPPSKKRRKVIGLDDLLADFYKEKSRVVEKEAKRGKATKDYNSDEDEDRSRKNKEALLSKFVDDCQKQVTQMTTEDELPSWGQNVFGHQKELPPLSFPGLGNCDLLQSVVKSELIPMLQLSAENGETFLEGLLMNGWLAKVVFACGNVEETLASWSSNLMFYSPHEQLQTSACEFWLSILQSKDQVNVPSIKIQWLPRSHELKAALEVYGYRPNSSTIGCQTGSPLDGPRKNIISWIKYLTACCQYRHVQALFSTAEVEYFIGVVIQLFLDRRLEGLFLLLGECLLSLINFFTDGEWISSCKNVAKSLAQRKVVDMNCLRIVECISGVNARSKHLRSEVALHILLCCLDTKVTEPEDVVRLLVSTNVREKTCDFLKIYLYLVLAENWLFSGSLLEQNQVIRAMWALFLRNCSCQITSTDWRSYASKVRNKASYLLQTTAQRDSQ